MCYVVRAGPCQPLRRADVTLGSAAACPEGQGSCTSSRCAPGSPSAASTREWSNCSAGVKCCFPPPQRECESPCLQQHHQPNGHQNRSLERHLQSGYCSLCQLVQKYLFLAKTNCKSLSNNFVPGRIYSFTEYYYGCYWNNVTIYVTSVKPIIHCHCCSLNSLWEDDAVIWRPSTAAVPWELLQLTTLASCLAAGGAKSWLVVGMEYVQSLLSKKSC